jgi:endo-1,4-beta-D-glucanase Y
LLFAWGGCAAAPATGTDGTGGDTTGAGGSGGDGGSGGAGGGMGGAAQVCAMQTPAPPAGGANFPFPQHRLSPDCGYPTNCNDADVQASWATYKSKLVVNAGGSNLRVQRPESSNDTVSEGIAYGMLMAVYMTDKATFDGLWGYAQTKFNTNKLMTWHWDASGSSLSGPGAASDADEDMAFALVMADKQWGGYNAAANALLTAMLNKEVSSSNLLLPDDSGNMSSDANPSYYAPAYYKVFQTYSGQARWGMVVTQTYATLGRCANGTTGLVPDWCNPTSGAIARSTHYGYDAARTPFRIALDACWNKDSNAVSYLAKVGAFFNKTGVSNIKDGYGLDGTVSGTYPAIAAFIGPAGVSGMPGSLEPLMRDAYGVVVAVTKTGTSSAFNYYNASWGLLSELLMTGNFVNLVSP